jgi:hypothetical protein
LVTKSHDQKGQGYRPEEPAALSALLILFLLLAGDAQPGVRKCIETLESDILAALMAFAEFIGLAVQSPQGLVHMPEVAPLGEANRNCFSRSIVSVP